MPSIISLQNLTRRFGELTAVDRLNLEIAPGEVFGLVGPDGAGKTTTLRLICGLMHSSDGRVLVDGLDVSRQLDEVKRLIEQDVRVYGETGHRDPESFVRQKAELAAQGIRV